MAQSTCFPQFRAPPFTPGTIGDIQTNLLDHDDPLWLGSGVFNFSSGATTHTDVRYVHGTDAVGGADHLVVSFSRVPTSPSGGGGPFPPIVFLALRSGANRMVLKLAPDPTTAPPAIVPLAHCTTLTCLDCSVNPTACRDQVSVFKGTDDQLFSFSGMGTLAIQTSYRVAQDGRMLIQAVIPVGVTSDELMDGLPATGGQIAFRSGWIEGAAGVLNASFPTCSSIAGECFPDEGSAYTPEFVAGWTWSPVERLTNGGMVPAGCTSDLEIARVDLGVMNDPNHTPGNKMFIDPTQGSTSNYFIIRPKNTSGETIDVKSSTGDLQVSARFLLADWGTQPSMQGPAWTEIGVANPAHAPTWPTVFQTGATALVGERFNLIHHKPFLWEEGCGYLDPDPAHPPCPAEKKDDHQCVLVQLSNTLGLNIRPSSVFRNMRFVDASTFETDAKATIEGLPPLAGSATRDLYLAVLTTNMPGSIPRGDRATMAAFVEQLGVTVSDMRQLLSENEGVTLRRVFPGFVSRRIQNDVALATVAERLSSSYPDPVTNADPELWLKTLLNFMPRYEVVAYVDSGRRVSFEGANQAVLVPQTSFGYFVRHQGTLQGWSHALDGPLQEISPGFYKVAIPHDGHAVIRTRIKALEDNDPEPIQRTEAYGGVFTVEGKRWPGGGEGPDGGVDGADGGGSTPGKPTCKCNKTNSSMDAGPLLPMDPTDPSNPVGGLLILWLTRGFVRRRL